jgi:hypothetical protein
VQSTSVDNGSTLGLLLVGDKNIEAGDPYPARSTVKETYDLILSDLAKAKEHNVAANGYAYPSANKEYYIN